MNEFQIKASPEAQFQAEWTLNEIAAASQPGTIELVAPLWDVAHAALALQARAEILLLQQRVRAKHGPEATLPTRLDGFELVIGDTVGRYDAAVKSGEIPAGPPELRIAMLAVAHGTRTLLRTLQPARGVALSAPPPTIEIPEGELVLPVGPTGDTSLAAVPWAVITVLGVAAIGGASWFAVEAKKANVSLKQHAMAAATQAKNYAEAVSAARATGQPIPAVPGPVMAAARAEATTQWWLLGVGVLAGGVAVYGGLQALRRPARAANPAPRPRRARRRRRRRNPAPPPAPRRAAPKRRAPKVVASAPPKPRAKRAPNPAPRKRPRSPRAAFIADQIARGRSKAQARAAWDLREGARKRRTKASRPAKRRAAKRRPAARKPRRRNPKA